VATHPFFPNPKGILMFRSLPIWSSTSKTLLLLGSVACCTNPLRAQSHDNGQSIPSVLADQFSYNSEGKLQVNRGGEILVDSTVPNKYVLSQMLGNPTGTADGIALDFHDATLDGTVSYGTYNDTVRYPTIFFLPRPVEMRQGKALLEIPKTFYGNSNDFLHFEKTGKGILGFRVMNKAGYIIYEGRVAFTGKGPYTVQPTIVEGPLVNLLTPEGGTLTFETQTPVLASVSVDGKSFGDAQPGTHHEINLTGLAPATVYKYTITYGDRTDSHSFRTALAYGSRKPFAFGFVADTRGVKAGGERDLGEVNYQATRAGMATAIARNIAFLQAMGGNTTGNDASAAGHMLEHANFKRALEPFWAEVPVYVGMGNHEEDYRLFTPVSGTGKGTRIAQFPYATESGAAAFAQSFAMPTNGPESEDGGVFDPSPEPGDFPSYKKNVYYYTYGNAAMIVLNSEYWKSVDPAIDGSPEGYVMDQELAWLDRTVQKFEADPKIDHVFVITHSAMFPSGDHTDAGMWYFGSNDPRPRINGHQTDKGIIERRDQIIDICINKSKKVVGFLTGSEHNFSTLHVTPDLPIYPENYAAPKLVLKRPFYVVNNGGGGAYSYARMNDDKYHTPWNDKFEHFTGPTSMAIFHVNGASVTLDAYNPETFETITEGIKLR
jgi:hypothetical protein